MTDKTYWRHSEAPARRVRAIVGKAPTSSWWCVDLEGEEIDAIAIDAKEGLVLISDVDGKGWPVVTNIMSSGGGYSRLPIGSKIVADR